MLQMAIVSGAPPVNYNQAYATSLKTGRPLVVLVGAEWCSACVEMKQQLIPQLKKEGALDEVVYTIVDKDKDAELADQLMRGSTLPQLLVFNKAVNGWQKQHMVGAQTSNVVRTAINTALLTSVTNTSVLRPPLENID
jgi:thiol-disulfide isomerase/thioredoxin